MNTDEPLTLDVRPLLASGQEPFALICGTRQKLRPGQSLLLIAPFQPLPLYSIFQAEGFEVRAGQVAPEEWHILFLPANERKTRTRDLDVREIPPPGPLEAGLEAIHSLHRDETLVLHTRFHPVHLFEQLDAEDFEWESEEKALNHWISYIWRVPANHQSSIQP